VEKSTVSSDGKLRFNADHSPAATVSQQSTGSVNDCSRGNACQQGYAGNWLTS